MSSMRSQQDSFYDAFTYREDAHVNSIKCFAVTTAAPPPQMLNWTHSYSQESDTNTIMKYLQETIAQDCPPPDELLKSIGMGFRKHLKDGQFRIQNGKLIMLQSILADNKTIILTVVPDSLRNKLFDRYHAGPTGGHMGEYKTLFRMRLRFFWPKMRSDIKKWCSGCAHCISYNVWRSRKSELYFLWPVIIPFWIMHFNIWSPGHQVDKANNKGYLLNCMCDLMQFIVSSVTHNVTAPHLSQLFMFDVILLFGMCAVVIIDKGGSNFKACSKKCVQPSRSHAGLP